MDRLDFEILDLLKKNGREKASAISTQVNLSVSAVIDRIKKMTSEGVIKGYTVHLDRAKMGQGLSVLMQVELENISIQDTFEKAVSEFSEVSTFYKTAGAYNYMLIAHVANSSCLDELQSKIGMIEGVGHIQSQIVLKEMKEEL